VRITVAIGMDPDRSSKCKGFEKNIHANQGLLVSVNTTAKRFKKSVPISLAKNNLLAFNTPYNDMMQDTLSLYVGSTWDVIGVSKFFG
jgi:hypothetical protein